jgi:hypothetical protein
MDIIKDYNKFFTAECGYPRFESKNMIKKHLESKTIAILTSPKSM